VSRTVWRFRVAAICLLLTTFAFLQSPGEVAADTKLDLTVDPVGFLGRALTLWDPQGFFGQLQNQAYGYLFPMGPFFVLGDLVALPPWVVQRLWWSVLLCAAFLGTARLAVLLLPSNRKGKDCWTSARWAALASGLAYALAPRMLTTIGPVSAEALPMVLAPWMLIPLVLADRGRDPRRMAALSGLAVLAMGAVNAVATLAVLPLGVWWILTRRRGRMRLGGWWAGAVVLASTWWAVPLLVLGRFSPPFLGWIESAAVTTRPNDTGSVLRGTSHWIAYVIEPSGPVWPGGWSLVSSPGLVLATGVVVAVALVGLSQRDLPERAFLVGAAGIGLTLVSIGHTGPVDGLGAEYVQDLLDGVLAPLRNVHKADVVLRLPVAIALGYAVLSAVGRGSNDNRSERTSREVPRWVSAVGAMAIAGVIGLAAAPLWTGNITRDRTHGDVPGYWRETASWLSEQGAGRALVVPASSFGTYIWGRTQDEPLQPIAASSWAVRDAVPLSSAGNIRLLDAVDEVLSTGRGSSGLDEVLARSGVRWLVVRNDLSGQARPPRPILVHQALDRSPGIVYRAGFGPILTPFRDGQDVVDDGLQQPYPAVEVWEVTTATGRLASTRAAREAWQLVGGPEGLIPAAEAELLDEKPVVLAGDPLPPAFDPVPLVTDTFRRTEIDVGQVRENRSATLTQDEPFLLDRGVHDYYPVDPDGRQPVAVQQGYAVRASSSGAAVTALRARQPSSQPWSALDADPDTAWVSGDLGPGVGQWWEVAWDEPVTIQTLRVAFVVGSVAGVAPSRVRVSTDVGEATTAVRPTDRPQRLEVAEGATRTLRITLDSVVDGSDGDAFGIAEVVVPGVANARPVDIPKSHDPGAIVLSARGGERYGCVHSPQSVQCSRSLPRTGEERSGVDRVVNLSQPGQYRVAVRVQPRPGLALDRLLSPGEGSAEVSTSSRLVGDPLAGPMALVDDDPRTAWLADPLEQRPRVRVALPEPRTVSGVRFAIPPRLAASRPLGVMVRSGDEERSGFVDTDGRLAFPPLDGQEFEVGFGVTVPVASRDALTGASSDLPLGIAELRLVGAEDLMLTAQPLPDVGVPCGFGPDVVVDGSERVDTSVRVPSDNVLETRVVEADTCANRSVFLTEGSHRITAASTAEFLVESVQLTRVRADVMASPKVGQPTVLDWQDTERRVRLPASGEPRILETTENHNDGWMARVGTTVLTPLKVDGWRQGWFVPAGLDGEVTLTFVPQRGYSAGLAAGAVTVVVLLALAVIPTRHGGLPAGSTAGGRGARTWTAVPVAISAVGCAGLLGLPVLAVAGWIASRCPRLRIVTILTAWGISLSVAVRWPWPTSLSSPEAVQAVAAATALLAFTVAALPLSQRRSSVPAPGVPPDSLRPTPSLEAN
jgi:arabinofuranan 3-O-arabinosyltransferase